MTAGATFPREAVPAAGVPAAASPAVAFAQLLNSAPAPRKAPPAAPVPPLHRRALVVFCGNTTLAALRWLRPGFRHCFVAVDDGAHWITIDPLLHRLEIRVAPLPTAFDLAGHYRSQGLIVIEARPAAVPLRRAPLGLFTCVEAVKRVLGLHARWVLTPWQLYRALGGEMPVRAPRHYLRTKQENILDRRGPDRI